MWVFAEIPENKSYQSLQESETNGDSMKAGWICSD